MWTNERLTSICAIIYAENFGMCTCEYMTCCSVLQRVAVCCSALQCVAVWCSLLQCVAVCCSVLQCVADSLVRGCSLPMRQKRRVCHICQSHIRLLTPAFVCAFCMFVCVCVCECVLVVRICVCVCVSVSVCSCVSVCVSVWYWPHVYSQKWRCDQTDTRSCEYSHTSIYQ